MTMPAERLLDMAGLAEYLDVPLGWVREKVAARQIPCHRIGKHVRFAPDDIDAILAATAEPVKRVPTLDEVAAKRAATGSRTA